MRISVWSSDVCSSDLLERELAEWIGAPRALLFGSGFLANLAVVQALLGDDDLCVQDRLHHASLVDAARLAGCRLPRYPHADPDRALQIGRESCCERVVQSV